MFSLTMLCSHFAVELDYSLILLGYFPHLVESQLDHPTEIPWTWRLLHPHTLYGRVGSGPGECALRALRAVLLFGALASALMCASCGSYLLPASGPNSLVVRHGETWNGPPFGLVKLTPQVVNVLQEFGPRSLTATFGDHRPPPEITFGIGDVVSTTIFEAAAGGLFIPAEASVRPGNFVTLPNQPVDTKGFISIPYAGLVPAAGKTPSQVEREIVDRIKNRAIEPQAVVALVTANSSLITVIGEINSTFTGSPTGRLPANPAGERLIDVITRAGGIRDQMQDLWVVLDRQGRRGTVPFGSLIYEPGNNIWAWPGDTLYVYREPQSYLVFGATGVQGQFGFTGGNGSSAWRVTLAEGVAAGAGLLDLSADPGSVFLYRREPRELAERLGVDCSKIDGPSVPVVYSVSFVDPAGYFLAQQVQLHNKDIIFAANAQALEVTKFATFFAALTSPALGVGDIANTISLWKIAQ